MLYYLQYQISLNATLPFTVPLLYEGTFILYFSTFHSTVLSLTTYLHNFTKAGTNVYYDYGSVTNIYVN